MEETTLDVQTDTPVSQPQGETPPSGASGDTSEQSQASVTGSEAQTEQDPFEGIPDIETLKQQAEQKLPNAEALYRIRSAYEAHKLETAPLLAWQEVATQFTDPAEVITQRDLLSKIHSPVIDPNTQQAKSGEFTTTPFLTDLETQSPGTVQQMLVDSLGFVVADETGAKDTLARHWFRSLRLDPDRVEDYRQIDARAPAGVVTTDQLVGIDPKFHDAFKALSQAQREDILLQRDQTTGSYPPAVMDYLTDKAEALEARKYREQDEQRRTQETQAQQRNLERETVNLVQQDITTIRREMYDSINKHLAEQWKPSTDEFVSKQEYSKVMGTLATLLVPEIRWTAEEALKASGTNFDPQAFNELVNTFAGAREGYVRFTRQGDQFRAKQALAQANLAKAQLKVKLDEYALALARPSADRLQTQAQSTVNALTTARVVPSGTVQPTNGNGNPYDSNPYQLGTPEYRAWNKNMDRQLGVSAAAGLTA